MKLVAIMGSPRKGRATDTLVESGRVGSGLFADSVLHFHPIGAGAFPSPRDTFLARGWFGGSVIEEPDHIIGWHPDGTTTVTTHWGVWCPHLRKFGLTFFAMWGRDGHLVSMSSGLLFDTESSDRRVWVPMENVIMALKAGESVVTGAYINYHNTIVRPREAKITLNIERDQRGVTIRTDFDRSYTFRPGEIFKGFS